MTSATTSHSTHAKQPPPSSRLQYKGEPLEKLFSKLRSGEISLKEKEFEWVKMLCYRAYPQKMSVKQRAEALSELLPNHPDPRTVENWIKGDHKPSLTNLMGLVVLCGVESVFWLIDPESGPE